MELQGKVAVITGASRGIGKAIAVELAKHGADIVVAARTDAPKSNAPGTIGETAQAIQALGRKVLSVRTDLSQQKDIDTLVKETLGVFGRVDILVNNAAFTGRPLFLNVWEMTREQFEAQVAVNVTAPFMLTKLFGAQMRQQGGGIVINMTSGAANFTKADTSDAWGQGVGYGTTKAALSRLTNGLARELKPYNIACIAVDPGATMTELMEMAVKSRGIKMSAHSLAVPAEAVVFLATHPNPMAFTGQVVNAAEIVGGVRFFQQIFG